MRRIPIPGRDAPKAAGLGAAVLALMLWSGPLTAQELEPSVNSASVIDFPTALDQVTINMVHGTVEAFDIAAPDLRLANLSYGRQWGQAQLLVDTNSEPKTRNFEYAEFKAKVRAISIDEQHTYIALGVVARWTDATDKEKIELDNKPYSLLGIVTTELYPFDAWGAFLVNFYLDNRYASLGLKVQIFQSVKIVTENDYHLGDVNHAPNKWRSKAGLQFDGDRNFYMQLLYDDAGNHMRIQMGAGF